MRAPTAKLLELLLLLLVLALAAVAAAPATPTATTAAEAPSTPPPEEASTRTIAHSDGKVQFRHRYKSRLDDGVAGSGSNTGTSLIKAPRRSFGTERVSSCPEGFDFDHKGLCRESW